jgi:hypothetical protein
MFFFLKSKPLVIQNHSHDEVINHQAAHAIRLGLGRCWPLPRCPAQRLGHPLPFPFPPSMQHRAVPPCLTASTSKSCPTPSHSPLLFSPSLSSAHGHASHLSSTPATEPPWQSLMHIRPPPSPSPPMVRPTHPLPFSDLEPSSALSSSPAALGASQRCRRPSLR